MGRIVTTLILLAAVTTTSLSTTSAWAQGQNVDRGELTGTRRQVATIIFSGLAGAILGLSTLSFYGRPQDHLNNVALGGAVGIIVGTVYTTYKSATRPIDSYDNGVAEIDRKIELDRQIDQLDRTRDQMLAAAANRMPAFQMSWSF